MIGLADVVIMTEIKRVVGEWEDEISAGRNNTGNNRQHAINTKTSGAQTPDPVYFRMCTDSQVLVGPLLSLTGRARLSPLAGGPGLQIFLGIVYLIT
jgi:hypothetical protein